MQIWKKKVKRAVIFSSFQYPLHFAVEQNDAEAVLLILQSGADRNLRNSKKQTALELAHARNAKQNSHAQMIEALSRSAS